MKQCWNRRPGGNSDYLLLYFYDPVSFSIGNSAPETVEKKWIIISPGTAHSYGNSDCSWNHSWIHFGGEGLSEILRINRIPINRLIHSDSSYLMEQLLYRLHEELYFNTPPDFQIIRHELSLFFIKLSRSMKSGSVPSRIPAFLLDVKKMIDFRYAESLSLEELSSHGGCSPQHLSKLFRRQFGNSPIDYLIDKRIRMAENLLQDTSLPIQEIADKVGYKDPYYFSKLFKKRTGLSPRAFRKRVPT